MLRPRHERAAKLRKKLEARLPKARVIVDSRDATKDRQMTVKSIAQLYKQGALVWDYDNQCFAFAKPEYANQIKDSQ